MLWFLFALSSAVLLGFYDVLKKKSLVHNAVIPVLFLNTLFSTLLFLPLVLGSAIGIVAADSHWHVVQGTLAMHGWVLVKSIIVLSSWVCGYVAIKHLPLTIVGPINATRPVMTLVGALLLFHEHLNLMQWTGVALAILAFFLMSRSGKREGIDFAHNRHILLLIAAAVFGAVSGLYDKFLLAPASAGGKALPSMFVQSWFNVYQMFFMLVALLWWWRANVLPRHGLSSSSNDKNIQTEITEHETFTWRWTIVGISLFLCAADMCYFHALSLDGALISVVSMTRRSSVLVSFLFGVFVLKERNVRSKSIDLLLVLLSLIFLCLGAQH